MIKRGEFLIYAYLSVCVLRVTINKERTFERDNNKTRAQADKLIRVPRTNQPTHCTEPEGTYALPIDAVINIAAAEARAR